MRVIAGLAKGCPLKAPEGMKARPTTDRIKESLFAAIQFDIEGKTVLDLFAGSGALGIEALSRGAEAAVFVDRDERCLAVVRENLQKTRLADKASLIRMDYSMALGVQKGRQFGLILLDPPYAAGFYTAALEGIVTNGLLAGDGIIVAECHVEDEFPIPKGLKVFKDKRYGITRLIYLQKETP